MSPMLGFLTQCHVCAFPQDDMRLFSGVACRKRLLLSRRWLKWKSIQICAQPWGKLAGITTRKGRSFVYVRAEVSA